MRIQVIFSLALVVSQLNAQAGWSAPPPADSLLEANPRVAHPEVQCVRDALAMRGDRDGYHNVYLFGPTAAATLCSGATSNAPIQCALAAFMVRQEPTGSPDIPSLEPEDVATLCHVHP